MGLYQNDFSIRIVKMRLVILCNFFHHLDRNIIRSIITWASECLLWIKQSNSRIAMSSAWVGRLHMKKIYFIVTGFLCFSDLIKLPGFSWLFWTNLLESGVIHRLVTTKGLSIHVDYLTVSEHLGLDSKMAAYNLLTWHLQSLVIFITPI